MFCIKCGTELPDEANFCFKCGYSLNQTAPNSVPLNMPSGETKLVPAKCTNCNATLTVDESKDAAICPYCNSAFIVAKAINNISVNNNMNIEKASFSMDGSSVTIKSQIDTENYILRAKEFVEHGNFEKATEYIEKALDQDPTNPKVRKDARNTFLKMALLQYDDDCDNALISIDKASKTDKDTAAVIDFCLYIASGNEKKIYYSGEPFLPEEYVKIRKIYKKALEISPSDKTISDSFQRMDYILTDYVYCHVKENTIFNPWDINLIYEKMITVDKKNELTYTLISNIKPGKHSVGFTYKGDSKELKLKEAEAEEFCKFLKIFSTGKRIAPSYDALQENGLITKDESGNPIFPQYSTIEFEEILKD